MTSVLSAEGLRAGYGRLPVVREVDLCVEPGEIVLLAGPNGAGKTTTLRCLSGQIAPMAGTLTFQGRRETRPADARARAGLTFVAERSALKTLTVEDNLRLGRGSVGAALELFPELSPLRKRLAGRLSGGEQQILVLARALAAQPAVLLIDEMSLGLAPPVVQRLITAIRAAARSGTGVLLVEQQIRQALEIAHRAYVMDQGAIAIEGAAADVKARLRDVEDIYVASQAAPASTAKKSSTAHE